MASHLLRSCCMSYKCYNCRTMSLTQDDLQQIKSIVENAVEPIYGKLEALEGDIKELYFMIADLQRSSITDKDFKKLTLEKKLLTLNAELLNAAKEAGITLPRP